MLRIDLNILWNLINIVVLFLLLKHFLFKPVNNILAKRQEMAEEQFKQADAKKAEAEESKTKYEALLQDAQSEKEKLTAEARQKATQEYGRIVDEAQGKADDILKKAKTDAEREKQVMWQQANAAIKDMVVDAAAKMVGAGQDEESDRRLYDRFLNQAAQDADNH